MRPDLPPALLLQGQWAGRARPCHGDTGEQASLANPAPLGQEAPRREGPSSKNSQGACDGAGWKSATPATEAAGQWGPQPRLAAGSAWSAWAPRPAAPGSPGGAPPGVLSRANGSAPLRPEEGGGCPCGSRTARSLTSVRGWGPRQAQEGRAPSGPRRAAERAPRAGAGPSVCLPSRSHGGCA